MRWYAAPEEDATGRLWNEQFSRPPQKKKLVWDVPTGVTRDPVIPTCGVAFGPMHLIKPIGCGKDRQGISNP
jgi:hypothetical protein